MNKCLYISTMTLLAALPWSGCTTARSRDQAFTQDWLQRQQRSRQFEERRARIEESPLPFGLSGLADGDGRVGIRRDEQGRPVFRLGDDLGLGADVGAGGGRTGAGLRYGLEW